jgi:hypothetical protein
MRFRLSLFPRESIIAGLPLITLIVFKRSATDCSANRHTSSQNGRRTYS